MACRALGERPTAFRDGNYLEPAPNPEWPSAYRVPYSLPLVAPRLLLTPTLSLDEEEIGEWVPILEELVRHEEALLIVTGEALSPAAIRGELFGTLLVNWEREVARVAVVQAGRPLEELSELISAASGASPSHFLCAEAPDDHVRPALPMVKSAYLRADASFLTPPGPGWEAALEPTCLIHVGGRDAEDQRDRLRLVCEALRG